MNESKRKTFDKCGDGNDKGDSKNGRRAISLYVFEEEEVHMVLKENEIIGHEISQEKIYELEARKGSKVEVRIEAKIKDLQKEDLEEILHEYAMYTHNFYLSLGQKIADHD